MQAFSITEPEAGSDTTSIRTFAKRDANGYVVSGHKNWTSRIEHSDLLDAVGSHRAAASQENRAQGISLFLVDLREVRRDQPGTLEVRPVRTMFNYATAEVLYKEMRIPADSLIGRKGKVFAT